MARTDFFEDADRLTIDEVRAELQAQEKRYRDAAIEEWAKADKEADKPQGGASAYYARQGEYYHGKANGIREALRAYAERGL